MTESLVPAVRTSCTAAEMYAALRGASGLTRAQVLVLLAQSAFETGRWGSMWCWNFGNAKHVPGDGRDYYQIRCNEIINGREVWFEPPDPATSFRAFPTIDAGCADYLALLEHRFAAAWPAVLAGDPAAFSHELKLAHYYTADEALYTRNLVSLYAEFDRTVPQDDPAPFVGALPVVDNGQPTPSGDLPPA